MAAVEAKHLGIKVDIIASSEDKNYSYIPHVEKIEGDYDYAYICFNNTIMGTHYEYIPDTGKIPLVADISSCVLSEELDVSKFGLLFAGAQKNLAPAGVTLVIIREDLITETPRGIFFCSAPNRFRECSAVSERIYSVCISSSASSFSASTGMLFSLFLTYFFQSAVP